MKRVLEFDYQKEPSRDILCIDCKSFYASCEAVARKLNPLTAKLVVMSYPSKSKNERGSGLILASSPMAKKAYNITNISRARDLPFPYPDDLVIAPPRMKMYMRIHQQITDIYRSFVDDSNIAVYSVDETFLDVTDSLDYFKCDTAFELARLIQIKIFEETGIYTTVGIGDNPLLAKLALDNESKHNRNMKAEWRYKDVETKLWGIKTMTDFWGIGSRTYKRLKAMGINSIYELAHADYYEIKEKMGIIGAQLYAHAWGIDRSFLGEVYVPKSKSVGNSQILPRDYNNRREIELVIREMCDQVASRLRKDNVQTQSVSLWVGYSLSYKDEDGSSGFNKQKRIPLTNNSKKISEAALLIFNQYYDVQCVRSIGITCSRLSHVFSEQMTLFESPNKQIKDSQLEATVDGIRKKYGFTKMIYTSSLLKGGRAIARSNLVGGHAGGMSGLEGDNDEEKQEDS